MSTPPVFKLTRLPTLKSPADFRAHCATLGINIPCDDQLATADSPIGRPADVVINGKRPGNRIVIHPMEGWDGTTTGGVTEEMRRRWQRFGESGAKMVCGSEAMAVRPDGRANPNQLIIVEQNKAGIAELLGILKKSHGERYGTVDDLVVGFQLTHSGRFCRPHDKRWESRIAFRHPILDRKFNVTSDEQVFTDPQIEELIRDYIRAAGLAWEIGADFVDLKHCHGYLLHEFLGAHTRPGKFGGSFENRTRILREIVAGIRAEGNPIGLGVRLSCFDKVPHRPDPELSQPGKLGPGIPEDFSGCLPYRYGFCVNQDDPTQIDLTEAFAFVALCGELGIQVLNTSAGSPYYTPHLQRPAAFPPSDGYQPAYDPLIDVERQIQAVRQIKARAPRDLYVIGSGYTYLQEFLPNVAQAVVRDGWADGIGIGRAVLSYPAMLTDAIQGKTMEKKFICRTFSECTTAPRNGLISGCYPLDKYYTQKPEFQKLKEIKKSLGAEPRGPIRRHFLLITKHEGTDRYLCSMKLAFVLAALLILSLSAFADPWPAEAAPLIAQAGNADDDQERETLLTQIAALPSLDEAQRKEAASLLDYVHHWNTASLKFYHSQVKGKNARAMGDYDFGVAATSPLHPVTELYRGRMLAWTLLENSTIRTHPVDSHWFKDEAVASFQHVAEAFPRNHVARMYLGEPIPWPKDYAPVPEAPEWAVLQREQLERMRDIIHWWIDHRQKPDAQFGGAWDDDCEMWRWWSSVLLGFNDPKITASQLRFSKASLKRKEFKDGFTPEVADVEHAAEDTTDNLIPLLLLEPREPRWRDWALHFGDLMRDVWTAPNERDHLQFKSFWFGVNATAPEERRAFDVIADVGALHPALLAWQRTADPKLGATLCAWLDTWVDATARAEGGKPAGILPASIHWPDGAVAGADGHWWEPIKKGSFMHSYYIWPSVLTEMTDALMLAHVMTGDERYLAPLRSMAAIRLKYLQNPPATPPEPGTEAWCAAQLAPRANANSNIGGLVKSLGRFKALTGTTEFDELLAREGGEFVVRDDAEGRAALVKALRESLGALRVNFPGFTSEVRSTDRCMRFVQFLSQDYAFDEYRGVMQPKFELLYRMVTGDKNAPRFPQMAVRWDTPPTDIAGLVTLSNTQHFTAELFHFGNDTRAFNAELRLLVPGQYRVRFSDGAESHDLPAITVERGDIPTVQLALPSKKLCRLLITPAS